LICQSAEQASLHIAEVPGTATGPCEMLDLEQLTKLLAGGCSFVYEMNYSFAYDMS
jgi:hypothetical protein